MPLITRMARGDPSPPVYAMIRGDPSPTVYAMIRGDLYSGGGKDGKR